MNTSLTFTYCLDGRYITLNSLKDENCEISIKKSDNKINVSLNAKSKISIRSFALKLNYSFNSDDKIYVNGYQSWTDTREYFVNQKMDSISLFTQKCLSSPILAPTGFNRSGDSTFHEYPRQVGKFYGFSYGYVRNDNFIDLFGSLSEKSGYTIITFDASQNCVTAQKDLDGKEFLGNYSLLDLAIIHDEYDTAFDKYFEMMNIKSRCDKRLCGYTTWYNYYGNITEEIVKRDLEAINKLDTKIDIFQIDDGYQTAVGDWLSVDNKKFPSGMKAVADEIHSKNMLAGLWLAPFAVVKKSKIFKEHPDWIIKDDKSKPYVAGPNWNTFYALDIYNDEVREYIANFFDVILNEWGYDMVKLDFLYAVCILPKHNKTRGEIMCDAMDFLRECCGDKLILGCGVPLMPAFGKVDFCRIGADIALNWKRKRVLTTREDVSTPNAVENTIFRRHLDSRAFMNDPDVFLLRDNNLDMSLEQKKLLAKINSTFGSLLFTSDNIGDYSKEQIDILNKTFNSQKPKIISAQYINNDEICVEYLEDEIQKKFTFNSNTGQIIK